MRKCHKGKYIPKNPEKYIGDPTDIVYRSRWELMVMNAFDDLPAVLRWGSEELIIPYFWKGDGKNHRYFTDFCIIIKTKTGAIRKVVIEVKPYAQTIEPVNKPGKKRKSLIYEIETYSKNSAKWEAAREYCRKHGMHFLIITEHTIFPNGKAW